jgi:hypothetical protein
MHHTIRFVAGWLSLAAVVTAWAGPPEISYVHPDYPTAGPRVVTGEGFPADGSQLEVLCWRPPESKEETEAGLQAWAQGQPPTWPAEPPKEATRVPVLDCEPQIAVAAVNGVVVWARTADGVSQPCAFDLPMPWWLLEEEARPGDIVALGGRALRALYRQDSVALLADGKLTQLTPIQPRRDYRTMDDNVMFLPLPPDLAPGRYQVLVHNGNGGRFGWRDGGWLTVVPKETGLPRRFDVREFGAKGDDEEPDTEALAKALQTAGKERGVVFFPPGRWRTEQTLVVPEGVTLLGAGRELSVIEGVGQPPQPGAQTTALVHPGSHVTLERLTFEGVVYRGPGHYWEGTIVGAPVPGGLHHVTVRQCRIVGQDIRVSDRRGFWPEVPHARAAYRMALALAEGHHHRVLDNDIVGPVGGGSVFDPLRRNEWTGNVIHGGGSADMVSLSIVVEESLVDANRLVDAPGRFMVTSPWRSIIRYNEVQDMWRGSWANAEETYLQHGGANDGADWCPKTLGTASTASRTTLTDAARKWKPDVYRGGCVLMTAGRGFGQWRRVTGNDPTTLTLAEPWRVVPDATSEYCVEKFFVENTYFGNVNDTPGRLSLWLDSIGCLVDSHRDVFSGGLDVWGGENTSPKDVEHQPGKPNYYPSFYNHFARCWLDGAPAWFYCDVGTEATPRGPMLFGNRMTDCQANRAHAARTGFGNQHAYSGAVAVGGHVPRDLTAPQSARVGLSHTVVASNAVSWTPVGVTVGQFARKTFVVGNTFEGVQQPLLDWGLRTFFLGNGRRRLDAQGHRQEPLTDMRSEREVAK